MRKAFSFLWVLALSACAGGGMQSHSGLPSLPAAADHAVQSAGAQHFASTVWNVQTGASHDSYAIQDLDFYPGTITIDAGDSISYRIASGVGGDAHTVAFVPPGQKVPAPNDPNDSNPAGGTTVDGSTFVNSGILFGGQFFTLHFPKAGTYRILCLFHAPAMASTVVVQKAGAPYPRSAQNYLDIGARDEWQDFANGERAVTSFPFKPGGTTLAAGIDPGLVRFPPPDSTVLRFLDSGDLNDVSTAGRMTVKVGTVLTWVNETSNEPHTVTFAMAGETDVPNIPPDPSVNVVKPPGITTYDGSQIVNSGTFVIGQKFMLKFTKAGTFYYGCLYHDNSRMVGTITVTP